MQPVTAEERVVAIDTLRGFALGGVLLINLLTIFRVPLSGHILRLDEPLGPAGHSLLRLMTLLVEFKAFTIFSFLFGAGVAIQAERSSSGVRCAFLLRRFGALLIIGLIHLYLIWNGDILTLYAVCGLLLIPLLRLPPLLSAILGVLLIFGPEHVNLPVAFPERATLRDLTTSALRIYREGSWREILAFRRQENEQMILPLLLLVLPRTWGLMLLGAAAWRGGLLKGHEKVWRWMLLAGIVAGAAGVMLGGGELANIGLSLAYAAAILGWNPKLAWVSAGGRMALTNYLTQSIVFGFVFYSYGLGLFGKLGVGVTIAGAVVFYCAQLAASDWWLRRFYFGPFEWLWRSISYLRWQPLVRRSFVAAGSS